MTYPTRAATRGGVGWLLCDMVLNLTALSLVKALGTDMPAAQVVLFRAGFGLLILLPWILQDTGQVTRVARPGLHLLRVGFSTIALTAGFFAVARMPFALFTTLNFLRPLVLMCLAALILREAIPRARWAAAALGLAGVAVALAPTGGAEVAGVGAVLISVLAGSGAVIVTRRLRGASEVQMMTFYTAGLAFLTLPVAVIQWVPVDAGTILLLAGVGCIAQLAQLCFIRAHWMAEAGVLAPLGYLSFIASAAVGFTLFSEPLTLPTLTGAVVIALSSWLVLRSSAGK
ncbi:MAG: DMT family transporter [Pseudomonadota bacterium]